jgi:hypothetical protein
MYSKNFMKKIGSVALAGVMAASLSIPAFASTTTTPAAETTTDPNTTVVDGAYKEIAIAVTVPATGTAQINPYGLPVEFKKSESSTKAAKVTGQQIVTQPLYISNEGDVALDINATVTTTIPKTSKMSIVAAKPADTDTEKDAYVYLQMVQSANKTLDETGTDKIADECAADATWAKASQLVLSTDDKVSSDAALATLAASKVTTDSVTYNVGSIVLYRLAGDVVTKPDSDWAETDTFSASIAFTFTPATTTAEATA